MGLRFMCVSVDVAGVGICFCFLLLLFFSIAQFVHTF